ncbi:hypothetical protein ATO13_09821 [Stappia sp. 22II-S9-Z10]|nr:hypothetical protein ATO13_09821 [Stappia sp. 22II-S9-Z10]
MIGYALLGRYNRWANRRVYAAAAALPSADLAADCGAAFGSVIGTLNHLVVTDRIWMNRFHGAATYPEAPLDATVSLDLAELTAIRTALDEHIAAFAEAMTEAKAASTFSYRRATTPDLMTEPMGPALIHFFNHQTHHRGQVHALLTRLAGAAPALDLIYFAREAATA